MLARKVAENSIFIRSIQFFFILSTGEVIIMVRVMSVYHFSSQSIQQLAIEELSASCLIPPDKIALARNSDHTIEIRLLNNGLNDSRENPELFIKSFSSVDDVEKMIYSKVGSFIVAHESRISNYEKAEICYVRIYVNWDKKSSPTQSLRARIAGKITPVKKTLEMIELPLNYNPNSIACCPSTGNILVNHKNVIQIFIFKYCTNETTKFQYIDFFEAGFQVELDFIPSAILLNEDVISCSNKQFFHVFKIIESTSDGNNSTTSESNIYASTEVQQSEASSTINLDQDVDFGAICDKSELNGVSFNVKIKSTQEESMGSMGDDSEMRPSVVNELGAVIKYVNKLPNSFTLPSKFSIQNLLQLKLQSMRISGVLRENVDVFKCMYMKPLYLRSDIASSKGYSASEGTFFMHSKFRRNFYGCAILITTQQDGYLYQVNTTTHEHDASKCFLNVYPFTSTVVDVFFNDNVLHALCENGIESYTHRIGQKIFSNVGKGASECDRLYKNLSTTISLVNLRPFMHVHYMIPGDDSLVLLANDSSTPYADNPEEAVNWTIYDLKYPTMETIYQDFKEFADKSLRKYPSVYMNLLEEIHLMIRNHSALARLELEGNSEVGNDMKLVWDDCDELLKDASLALADYFIL